MPTRPVHPIQPVIDKGLWILGFCLWAGFTILFINLFASFPIKVLAVGFGIVFLLLAIYKLEIFFYVVVFFLILLQEADAAPGSLFAYFAELNRPGIPSLLEALLAALSAAFLARLVMLHRDSDFSPLRLPCIAFGAMLVLSLALGFNNHNDGILLKEDLKRFILPVLFFITAVNVVGSSVKIINLLRFMFFLTLIKTYFAIFYYFMGLGFPYGDDKVVFLESGDQILIVTAIVVGIAFASEKGLRFKTVIFFGFGVLPMIFALLFSYRRNALWGTLASIIVLLLLAPLRHKVKLLRIAACAAMAVLIFASFSLISSPMPSGNTLKERFLSVTDPEQSSNMAHVNEWNVTFNDIMKHPVLGLGLGSQHAPVPDFEDLNRHTVHNAFLMLWMKMGLPALMLLLWCMFIYVRLGIKMARMGAGILPVALFSTFAFWLVAMSVGPSWWYYRETCLMALVISVVVRHARNQRNHYFQQATG